jgi:hypothetical protein
MRVQYADALISCNKYQQINCQLPNEVIALNDAASRACATRSVAESEMSLRSTGPHRKSRRTLRAGNRPRPLPAFPPPRWPKQKFPLLADTLILAAASAASPPKSRRVRGTLR